MRPHREPLSLAGRCAWWWRVAGTSPTCSASASSAGSARGRATTPGCCWAWWRPIVAAFWLFKVPQGMWRFSGFGEVKRLVGGLRAGRHRLRRRGDGGAAARRAARGAGAAPGGHADGAGAGAHGLPHAVRALARCASPAATPRCAARWCSAPARRPACWWPASTSQGWIVLGLLDDDPLKQGARIAGVPVLGPLSALRDKRGARRGHAPDRGHALGARRAAPRGARAGRRRRAAGGDGALGRRTARRQSTRRPRCARSSPKTCSAASRCSSTRPASPPRCAARRC